MWLESHLIVELQPLLVLRFLVLFPTQRKHKAGRKGKGKEKEETATQPKMRMDYCEKMGGADTADQQNGSNTDDHKSYSNHWRRVIEQKVEQSCTNGFLCCKKWVPGLKSEAQKRLESAAEDSTVTEQLRLAIRELDRLAKLERTV